MDINRVSTPTVSPANWTRPNASVKKDWSIWYYYYTDQGRKKKVIKGMNHLKTWSERHKFTKELLDAEILKLSVPAEPVVTTKAFQPVKAFDSLESALTSMVNLKRKVSVPRHCNNLQTMVKRYCAVGGALGFKLKVHGTTRQMCLYILENLEKELLRMKEKNFKSFSDKSYNRYLKDMGTLFNDLIYWEYTDYNPFAKMKKRTVVKELKRVATPSERQIIDRYIKQKDRCYWRFMHIFFHSGAREAELCRMKMTDVHLEERYFIVEIRKGQSKRKEIKAMLPEAYGHWAEIVKEGGEHPFGTDFQPGSKPVLVDQVSKLWKRYVKDELKLGHIDFYSLKHLHTDLIAEMANLDLAKTHDDHMQEKTTESIYAVGSKKRKLDKLKQLNIKF